MYIGPKDAYVKYRVTTKTPLRVFNRYFSVVKILTHKANSKHLNVSYIFPPALKTDYYKHSQV